jgi:hypothetical protein
MLLFGHGRRGEKRWLRSGCGHGSVMVVCGMAEDVLGHPSQCEVVANAGRLMGRG